MKSRKEILEEADKYTCFEERYFFLGTQFGYPKCCIEQFLQKCGTPFWFESLPWYSTRTLKLDGFVPCEKCATLPRDQLVDDINSRRKVEK